MWQYLAFIIKIVLATALAVWLATNPGNVVLHWLGYEVRTSAAFFTAAIFILVALCLVVYRALRWFLDGPRLWREKNRLQRLEKGQQRLLEGLIAVASGDTKLATQKAKAVQHLLPGKPLTQLLLAQAADLSGHEEKSAEHFRQLLLEADSAVLGYRGLINLALRKGDVAEAKKLAAELGQRRADVPWLHMVTYEISLREQNWNAAGNALRQAYVHRQLGARDALQRQAAVALARAENALAVADHATALQAAEDGRKLQSDWPPVMMVMARALAANGKRERALRLLADQFRKEPDLEIAKLLAHLLQPDDALVQHRRAQKFTGHAADDVASHWLLATTAQRAKLWGEARRHMFRLEQLQPDQWVYQQLAQLEEAERGDHLAAKNWLEKAVHVPPAVAWECSQCNTATPDWRALCPHCGALMGLSKNQPVQAVLLPAQSA